MEVRKDQPTLLAVAAVMATIFLVTECVAVLHASTGAVPLENGNEDYVRLNCSNTPEPSLCYTSLVPYADVVGQDPGRLARLAANVSLIPVMSAFSCVTSVLNVPGHSVLDKATESALRDCEDTLGNAAELTRTAVAELGLLPGAQCGEVALRVSNAESRMSADVTNVETCVNGFTGVTASAVKVDVGLRALMAELYMRNALALISRVVQYN